MLPPSKRVNLTHMLIFFALFRDPATMTEYLAYDMCKFIEFSANSYQFTLHPIKISIQRHHKPLEAVNSELH